MRLRLEFLFFFFFNDTATTEIYTLSLHDALPICPARSGGAAHSGHRAHGLPGQRQDHADRKSTRLNSSHGYISYAVFCLKKKKKHNHARSTLLPTTLLLRQPATSRVTLYSPVQIT